MRNAHHIDGTGGLERFADFMAVIPAQAGIHAIGISVDVDSRLRGNDGNDVANNCAKHTTSTRFVRTDPVVRCKLVLPPLVKERKPSDSD